VRSEDAAMDEPFVQFLIPCKCGVDLQIHGQHFKDGRWGSRNIVKCPKCKTEHELPTNVLRLFYRDGNLWYIASPEAE
jgi:hypothetical protein